MKTIDEVGTDLSVLYDQLRDGGVELKYAAELANIGGKVLKAHQLNIAKEIFASGMQRKTLDGPVLALTNAA